MSDYSNYIDDMDKEDFSDGAEDQLLSVLRNIKETSDLYYLALLILTRLGDTGRYSTISEMAFLLDTKSFLNLVYYYGGQTITIPTQSELESALKLISIYYYYEIQGFSWHEALVQSGVPTDTTYSLSYKSKLVFFKKQLAKLRFPHELKVNEDKDVDDECK